MDTEPVSLSIEVIQQKDAYMCDVLLVMYLCI